MRELWSEGFVSEITLSQYCSLDSHVDVIHPKLSQKGPRLVFHVPMGIERWKSIVKGNLRWSIGFWNHCLKTSSTQKWVKKVQIGISCTNVDRKMKIKSKKYFAVNYSFMKPFSQNLSFWLSMMTLSTQNWLEKRVQTRISCTNGDRKMKIKRKRNFEVRRLSMKLFSRNLEILAPCCDVISLKLGQKHSSL